GSGRDAVPAQQAGLRSLSDPPGLPGAGAEPPACVARTAAQEGAAAKNDLHVAGRERGENGAAGASAAGRVVGWLVGAAGVRKRAGGRGMVPPEVWRPGRAAAPATAAAACVYSF